ncbi:type IV secretory system conjugative DNA transfer family protein [Massilia sp. TSP1-1-2]|uniref:type IV secretory system conjugative DNA transfer family protein n=1 Tax=Massilia sp. TSP1-1-2 TaxID=2804649 RepID=UPI003CFB17FD
MNDRFNNAVGPQVRTKKKGPGKVIPALVALSLGGGLQAATQFFANDMRYQGALGAHINHFYVPWGIVQWATKWYGQYPDAFMRAGSVGVSLAGVSLISLAVVKMVLANTAKANEFLHGSARWANKKDIQDSGLLPRPLKWHEIVRGVKPAGSSGVYVGAWVDSDDKLQYLRHDGPEHCLMYAPTRSGKGVGPVTMTLLSWPGSCLVTDLKGELWAMTAGWRKEYAKNKMLRFEPADPNCDVFFNPMDEIGIGTGKEVGDVQNLATLIVDPEGKGLESHWQKTSQALLVGVILHAMYKRKNDGTPATLPYVDHMLADPDRSTAELWMEMATYGHVDGKNHPVVGAAARDMMDRPEEEAGSVLSTAKSYLALYRDPIVARNVSSSSFRIKDLMNHDSPVSLYIVTQPTDKNRLRPLVRIMLNQIVRLLADKMEFERLKADMPLWRRMLAKLGFEQMATTYVRSKKGYKHRLLGMIDEFPSLGKLEIMEESLAFVAGYGIKFYLICQDINQLKSQKSGYGPDETITSNCHVQNAYPPNRLETAEHLSKLTGVTTVVKEQITTSGKRTSALLGQVSRTIQEVQRPLLTTDECQRMPGPKKDGDLIVEAGDMVIYVAGFPAIYGRQPLYFQDKIFTARAAVEEPKHSDKVRNVAAATEEKVIEI